MSNEDARIHFDGLCPYTNIACEGWNCSGCEVNKREEEWLKEDERELEWILTKVLKHEEYSVVEIKCPVCGMKETLTRYNFEDKEHKCYICEEARMLPEIGDVV